MTIATAGRFQWRSFMTHGDILFFVRGIHYSSLHEWMLRNRLLILYNNIYISMLNMTEMFMCRICVCFDMYRPKHLNDVCNHMWQLIFAWPDPKKQTLINT